LPFSLKDFPQSEQKEKKPSILLLEEPRLIPSLNTRLGDLSTELIHKFIHSLFTRVYVFSLALLGLAKPCLALPRRARPRLAKRDLFLLWLLTQIFFLKRYGGL
jgi:hypothetical protein